MDSGLRSHQRTESTAELVRRRIVEGGERVWRCRDFPEASATAVAQTLSRMVRKGELRRLSNGLYYRARQTAFGESRPNPATLQQLATRKSLFPAGLFAAGLLGFTTQTPSRNEVATSGFSLPRKLLGADAVIHTRRPEAWIMLSQADAALLDFLRRRGDTSELSPQETARRTLDLFREAGRFDRLCDVAPSEPPRVRAMLGAIGETLGQHPARIDELRASLNPLSRFDFGMLRALPNSNHWQAKEGAPR